MISSLTGKAAHKDGRFAVIDVNGVGYKVAAAADTLAKVKTGDTVTLWTHLAVRDNAMELFGFLDKEALDFFELLITVSGIGPKTALAILSVASPEVIRRAVASGDTSYLTKVSGLGKKKADKIVLELQDKIGALLPHESGGKPSEDVDVVEALKSLGYGADDAREALKKLDKKISGTGARVKAALKVLGK
jgi:Holliday junction DNA helicase RuvA